jgi:prephenate dehydrogenase
MQMKSFEIGIIGGTGGIGKWFANYFRDEGYRVHVSGRTTGLSMGAMAGKCAVVIVSVPIEATTGIIRSIGPCMKKDSLLMDLTSLKREPVREMLACSVSEVIGCHPLFGPDVESLGNQNIVICPGRGHKWLPWLSQTLENSGARIVRTTPVYHDRMMSLIQGLNHINTISLGLALRQFGIDDEELDKYSTPIFRAKMSIVEKVFHQSPGLYAEIITGNPDIEEIIFTYEKIVSELKDMIVMRDTKGLKACLEEQSAML